MKNLLLCLLGMLCIKTNAGNDSLYKNPIISESLPDPTVIYAPNRCFYLYATEDTKNIPIYKSSDLIEWEFVGTAFENESRPTFLEKGDLWAPDINYINGKYVLYYTLSKWGELDKCGIGVAVSESPEGPFRDLGKLFTSEGIGVKNSIDQFYFEDKGKKYIFWGSQYGIYGIELTDDGLALKKNAKKKQIAGTFMEGTAIEKRNGYYYLFGSAGTCCRGKDSKYHIVYGRSNRLFGPYVTKDGKSLLNNNYEILLLGNDRVAGPGHQSRLLKDKKGSDWLIYHGYLKDSPQKGRLVFMDKIEWIDDWPYIKNSEPSTISEKPFVK